MTKTLLYIWPRISSEVDFCASNYNPPHHAFKSLDALEWAGRAIGEAFYNKVLIAGSSLVCFAAQTFKTTPKLNIPTPILTFQRYDYF